MLNELVSLTLLITLLLSVALDAAHRTTVALGIAIIAVVIGSILPDPNIPGAGYFGPARALAAVNFQTLIFIVAMGVFMAIMQRSGAFDWVSQTLVLKSKMQPGVLTVRILLLSYLISLFVNNVTVVFILIPITLGICRQFDLNPVPLSVAQVIAINLGGASTQVGDFPNIIIATSVPTLTFLDFLQNMLPMCFALLVTEIFVFSRMYPQYFTRFEPSPAARVFAADLAERRSVAIKDKTLLAASVLVFASMLAMFVIATQLRIPLSLIPLAGAGIILMVYELRLRKSQSLETTLDKVQRKNIVGDEISRVLAEVHWDVVLFLAALFVVIGSLEHTAVLSWAADFITGASQGNLVLAALLIVLIASFITMSAEAGPATAVFVPVIQKLGALGSGGLLYWALSFGVQAGSSTTMIGANEGPLSARMIEQAARIHDSSDRLTARGFTRIGGRMWLVFIPLSIVYLTGLILLGPVVSLVAFVVALVVALWIAVRGL
jgi:Na+/H+ antiporter NhaD/arsenite permease-like protein